MGAGGWVPGKLDVKNRLIVRGAREHNLKDVHLDLPRDAMIVFTGLSGSGKSSLALDTIFAEGQRRYMESLSTYARQFLGQLDKPDVDVIEGLLTDVLPEAEPDGAGAAYEAFMRAVPCPACGGARLAPEILAVTVGGRSIADLASRPVREAADWLRALALSPREQLIAERPLSEIQARLGFLADVGLDYLSLDRPAATLAGGEAQRIRLATQIGSGLTGVLYVLDEPSIGLHQRDNQRLIETLTRLRDLGNTLIVVEHDEDTIAAADWVVDIGPQAGEHGGRVVVSGTVEDLKKLAGVDHRGVPVRAHRDRGAGQHDGRGARAASWSSRARASTTCAASTSRSRWAASWR